MNDITRMVTDLNLTKINQLYASTLFKKDDFEITVSMLLGEIVIIGVRNIPHQKRAGSILKVVNRKLIDMGDT